MSICFNHCRGSMATELAVAVVGLLALFALVAIGLHDRAACARLDHRAADQETALNLLAEMRHGRQPPLPPGWRLRATQVTLPTGTTPGSEQVTVIGSDHVQLSTVRPTLTATNSR